MKSLIITTVAVASLFFASPGSARMLSAAHHTAALTVSARLHKSETLVNWYQHKGHWTLHPAHKTCWSVRYSPERARCIVSRRNLRWHEHRIQRIEKQLTKRFAAAQISQASSSWFQSISLIRRYYGDAIANWEDGCSATEGGHGGFVWFGHASTPIYGYSNTPGGNLQFMGGTFDGIIGEALAGAAQRGLIVQSSLATFYTPLGQAIAGAQMYLDGRSGEWTGSGC